MLIANITDMTVHMRFQLNNNIGTKEYSYSLGDELFNFLSFDIADVYAVYIQIADAFMDYHYGAKNEKAYKEKLTALCGELDSRSIYLHACKSAKYVDLGAFLMYNGVEHRGEKNVFK